MEASTAAMSALNVFSLLLLLFIVYFIVYPKPLVNSFIKRYNLISDLSDERITVVYLEDPETEIKLRLAYYIPPGSENSERVIVEIPGGAFVASYLNFDAYFKMETPFPVFVIEYPVLFKHRAPVSFQYLKFALKSTLELISTKINQNAKITLVGSSAGAYYSTILIKDMPEQIDSLCTICGYFGYTTMRNKLWALLERFYLNTSKEPSLVVDIVPTGIRYFPMTSTFDFLGESSTVYAERNAVPLQVYSGNHTFFWNNSQDAQQARADFLNFVKNQPI